MNKKIIFLLSIPIFGFLVFLIVHFSFLKDINNSTKKTENTRVKQIVSSDINYEIIKIKSFFYQIPLLSTTKRSLQFNMKRLKKELTKTKHLLMILKNGGVYKKRVSLNIVNKAYFEKNYIFKKDKVSLEVIDLLPKIEFLEKKANQLNEILLDFYVNKNSIKMNKAKQRRKKLVRFSRSLDSVFRRMIENSNRLFYESQIELMNIENKLNKKSMVYKNIEFSLIIFLILSFVLIGYLVIKQLTSFNEALTRKLYTDELTQVFSRAKLEEESTTEKSILILIDIDDFSSINEIYGMENGNRVLKVVADKLKTYNEKWQIFRVSSDVFGLYLDDDSKLDMSVEAKIEHITRYLMFESINIEEYIIDINVTMGIGFGKNVLHDALAALNIAKSEKLPYVIFHEESEFKKNIEFNLFWQKELKLAVAEDRIEPFFQPIVDKYKTIIKYECLMRVRKEENGEIKYIPPFFLDVAIKTKQYLTISRQMIEKTFVYFKDGGEFSINLNYLDMKSDVTIEFLETLIKEYDAQNRVTFEVLESEGIKDYQLVENFLNYFRQYGVKIAIDDFGSGYSNFKRIMQLNPDYIKFDGSLIKNIDKDKNSYIIVKNMVNYAKELKIQTVAEFVENKDIFDTCVYLGIDYFQGYYISRPKKEI